jgi:phage baseplate assembly protein W
MANEVALSFPFSLNPKTGSINVTSDQGAIWSNRVRIATETLLGERIMRPEYGSRIPSTFFATTSSMEDVVRREISRIFVEQFPLLGLNGITVTNSPREDLLTIDIFFNLPNKTTQTVRAGILVVSENGPLYEEKS